MSQFDALFNKSKNDAAEKPRPAKSNLVRETKKAAQSPTKRHVAAATFAAADTAANQKKRTGKSSDENYTQVLTYLKRDTHNAVRASLIFDDQKRDLSELVEELLTGWVQSKK